MDKWYVAGNYNEPGSVYLMPPPGTGEEADRRSIYYGYLFDTQEEAEDAITNCKLFGITPEDYWGKRK